MLVRMEAYVGWTPGCRTFVAPSPGSIWLSFVVPPSGQALDEPAAGATSDARCAVGRRVLQGLMASQGEVYRKHASVASVIPLVVGC
jgi:hypothetical protein